MIITTNYEQISEVDFEVFKDWLCKQPIVGVDTETNMVEHLADRELKLIQFGTVEKGFVLRWRTLTDEQKSFIAGYLNDEYRTKVIHNSVFEYTILRKYGIFLKGIYDTMLVEKIFYGGYSDELDLYSLKGLVNRYCAYQLDKSLQTSFDDDTSYSNEQLLYAALDVKYLIPIYRMQADIIKSRDDEWVVALENENIRGYGEIEFHGLELDINKWLGLLPLSQSIVDESIQSMEAFFKEGGELYNPELGFVTIEDRINFSWNSPKKVKQLFKDLIGVEGSSKTFIKGFLKTNGRYLGSNLQTVLTEFCLGNTIPLEKYVLENHRDYLVSNNLIIPKDTCLINWNSPTQRLKALQLVHPELKSTRAEELADVQNPHPLLEAYIDYSKVIKMITTYGESFITKYVQSDGKVRTSLNPIVSTGRSSSSNPNMQNIPANDRVGTVYRNCFIDKPGRVFVDSDYASQELVIIAYMSNDPVWNEALRLGQDLHSVCAELVFKSKWVESTGSLCEYYHEHTNKKGETIPAYSKSKCSCKGHKVLRNAIKSINFGLAYGMSAYKLSSQLKISFKEAESLILEYFSTFPAIAECLKQLGEFGVRNGYIITPAPFFRKRYFPVWHKVKDLMYEHLLGDYNPTLGSIERQSKNTPIQGGAADMVKLALCFIMWYLEDNNLLDIVHIKAVVHDQITTTCPEEIAEKWKVVMDKLMVEAGKVIVKNGLLKAETTISPYWTK